MAATKNVGKKSAAFVRFLCSASPLPFFILVPFYLINFAISFILFLSAAFTKTNARSFPPSISTKQLISVESCGTN
jgi:hypothetical protein